MIKRSIKVAFAKIRNYLRPKILMLIKYQHQKKNHIVDKALINKYFIEYSDDNDNIEPLCIKLTQMIGYFKYFRGNKTMSFKVNDEGLLEKYS